MYLYGFFLVAAALAIPTFGLSLLIFSILKRAYDKRTIGAILASAVTSMREGVTTELFRVNRAAVHRLFDKYCVSGSEDGFVANGYAFMWGCFAHPMIDEGRQFSLRVIRHPRGQIDIRAAPGIDADVLSDNLEGIGSFRLAALARTSERRP